MFCTHCGNNLKEDVKFCTNCGNTTVSKNSATAEETTKASQVSAENFFKKTLAKLKNKEIRSLLIGTGLIAVIIVIVLVNHNSKKVVSDISVKSNTQSVVGIWCDNEKAGSGTIFTTDGTILTNNHVIKDSTSCKITIPDPITGAIKEIYVASPIVLPKLSDKYDVATLKINAAYTDADGKTWGTYPTTFSTFILPKTCNAGEASKLADSVKIYGYPVTSGGYNLTVTDGLISSFSDDGNILTSAQVDNGNSGGLAVDQDGCWLGIPSAVVSGNYQSLGVIIPGNIVEIFLSDVPVKINPSAGKTNSVYESAFNPQKTSDQQCQDSYGPNSEWNGQADKEGKPRCDCQSGYSWSASGNSCVTKKSLKLQCQNQFGRGSYSTTEDGKAVCDCSSGYKWNNAGTSCVSVETSYISGCTSAYGYSSTTGLSCSGNGTCSSGSTFDTDTRQCIDSLSPDQMCNQQYNNSYSTFDPTTGSNSCNCKAGYYWDNNVSGQIGNCFTQDALDQGCNKSIPGTRWNGKYTSDGTYQCDY